MSVKVYFTVEESGNTKTLHMGSKDEIDEIIKNRNTIGLLSTNLHITIDNKLDPKLNLCQISF